MPRVQKRRRGRESSTNYVRYIQLVRDQVCAGRSLSTQSKAVLNALVVDQLARLGGEAGRLAEARGRATVGRRELAAAVQLLLPAALQQESLAEGDLACAAYARSVAAA